MGVPSLHLAPVGKPGVEGAWLWEETARFARLQFLVALVVADDADRPAWNKGDFFERFLKPERPARR